MLGKYLRRNLEKELLEALDAFPAVAIPGPRQAGKSTLAGNILKRFDHPLYLDLERPSDLRKLTDAELFLTANADRLVCLDEIQRRPDLFPVLRALIDDGRRNGRFLILGSASQELIRQSSESLAGRVLALRRKIWVVSVKGDKLL